MDAHDKERRVRGFFAAFLAGDRSSAEATMATDFTFTSPYDDHIDRVAYFERCWPNRARIRTLHLEQVVGADEHVFVLYEVEPATGGSSGTWSTSPSRATR
jgi:ketosteroid isomerase-like protein